MSKKLSKEPKPLTILDALGKVIHSSKIKRGYLYQKAIYTHLAQKYQGNFAIEVRHEEKITVPKNIFKTGKHTVDIVVYNTEEKTITMINSKSNGISNTDNHKQIMVPQMTAAKNQLKADFPDYNVSMIVLRPDGNSIREWEEVDIQTINSSVFIGEDIDLLVAPKLKEVIAETVEKCITEYLCSEECKHYLRNFAQKSMEKTNSEAIL